MAAAGIFVSAILFTAALVHCSSFPTTLTLERSISPSHDLSQLKELDINRFRRSLLDSGGDIIFNVKGQYQPPAFGLYYTRLSLGTPAKDYYVQLDTGSNVVWVSCTSCEGCPAKNDLGFPVNYYDPGTSSSSGLVGCWDPLCNAAVPSKDAFCSSPNTLCGFQLQYSSSNAYGYYVADTLSMYEASDSNMTKAIEANLIFGCAAKLTGNATKTTKAVGGVLGLGPRNLSFISQLARKGITPRVFSHCLRGDSIGGGMLVLGEFAAPRVVYTPLIQSESQYKVDLQSISVDDKTLAIDRSVFKTTATTGTIVDSGTTLAYLADGAYDPVIEAISDYALTNAISYPNNMYKCFLVGTRIDKLFPTLTFNFAGGASMVLTPSDYLVKQNSLAGDVRCIGFETIPGQQTTILGDLVLKDKLVIYDMENQRFGWTGYNCSVADSVSSSPDKPVVKNKSSPKNVPCNLIPMVIIVLLLQMFL